MMINIGIDIGSSSIKIVLLDEEMNVIKKDVTPSGSLYHKNGYQRYLAILDEMGIGEDNVKKKVVTGYGRKLYKWADKTINEITSNAKGADFIFQKNDARKTVVNIGGQDSKIINVNGGGTVQDFVMNDKCAAGTGRFLEMTARILEIGVDDLGDYHFKLNGDYAEINSTCAVFAESEIISLLTSGVSKEEIVAGVHFSIAKRMYRMASRLQMQELIILDGGVGLNNGLKAALEEEFLEEFHLSPFDPQFTVAIGAAVEAASI